MSASFPLHRRDFVRQTTGAITGTLGAVSGMGMLAGAAGAADLAALTSVQGETLMAMIKTIAPHDRLDDAAYLAVVKSIDRDLQADAGKKQLLAAGLLALSANGGFAAMPEAQRVAALRAIEPTPFFQVVRVDVLQRLYATPQAFALFGYEGESFSKGGYLRRGFNDLRWLPEPPAQAAGPVL